MPSPSHSFTFPSAQLLVFQVKAELAGVESDKMKVPWGNLSFVGQGHKEVMVSFSCFVLEPKAAPPTPIACPWSPQPGVLASWL